MLLNNLLSLFTSYITILVTLALLDGLWLGVLAKNFYKENLGYLFRAEPIWSAIVIFYLIYAAAIVYFAVLAADGSWLRALSVGAILGFVVYMTYDLVNYATIKDWPLKVVFIDILWGTFITATAATLALFLNKFLS